MVLVIDIGNSNLVMGLFESGQLRFTWRAASDRSKTEDEYGMLVKMFLQDVGLTFANISGVIISSVVPPLLRPMERMCNKYLRLRPLVVGPGVRTGLNIKTENPREVGSDRIVNAVAAIEIYGPPVIVVDFGTATTYCVVDEKGHYVGGVIAPGMGISTEALNFSTAQLPRVEIVNPGNVIGRNTITSLQSGIFYGIVGQVDEIVRRIRRELRGTRQAKVVATGGFAELVASESQTIDEVHPYLTLKGLYFIYQKNLDRKY